MAEVLVAVKCPLCASKELKLITNHLRFQKKADVYRCVSCSLVFLDQNSFTFPKDFYEKEYHQTYITHVEPDALNPQVYFEKMKKSTKIWADRFCEILTGNEVVLDVGCSTGHFMDLVKGKTKKIYGHELSRVEVDFCQKNLGLDVSNEPLAKRFKPETFDYITMIFVLEHIAEPVSFLKELKTFLKPNGKFVILVPNIQDALVNFYDIDEFQKFYYCIEHLFYYEPKTLELTLEKAGLTGKAEVIQEYPITNHLQWAYKRGPSDVLVSRQGIPNAAIKDSTLLDEWEGLWREFNQKYQKFLKSHGFGDRVWAVAKKSVR